MLSFLPAPTDRNPMTRLILMCGLPGSGKTTRARRLAADRHAIRLSPDEWLAGLGLSLFDEPARDRLEQLLWQHAQDLLRLGTSVILENGFWRRAERDHYRDTARALHVAVELHYLDVPQAILHQRVAGREPTISAAQLDHYATLFEAPTAEELSHYDEIDHRSGR
jgi:predicted kinase